MHDFFWFQPQAGKGAAAGSPSEAILITGSLSGFMILIRRTQADRGRGGDNRNATHVFLSTAET